jgi:hypothetical protein
LDDSSQHESTLEKFEEILEKKEDFAPPFQIAELDKSFGRSQLTDRSDKDLRRRCPGYRFESKEENTSQFEFIFVMSGYEEDEE